MKIECPKCGMKGSLTEEKIQKSGLMIICPKCKNNFYINKSGNTIMCSNCGYELPKCSICNLVVDDDDQIETCPECGAIGHRTHFREWVHIKGVCPICKKNISFS